MHLDKKAIGRIRAAVWEHAGGMTYRIEYGVRLHESSIPGVSAYTGNVLLFAPGEELYDRLPLTPGETMGSFDHEGAVVFELYLSQRGGMWDGDLSGTVFVALDSLANILYVGTDGESAESACRESARQLCVFREARTVAAEYPAQGGYANLSGETEPHIEIVADWLEEYAPEYMTDPRLLPPKTPMQPLYRTLRELIAQMVRE